MAPSAFAPAGLLPADQGLATFAGVMVEQAVSWAPIDAPQAPAVRVEPQHLRPRGRVATEEGERRGEFGGPPDRTRAGTLAAGHEGPPPADERRTPAKVTLPPPSLAGGPLDARRLLQEAWCSGFGGLSDQKRLKTSAA